MSTYTLRLGPLSFRTTADAGPTEALGNAVEVVGAALTSADPAPKPFTLVVPVGWAGRSSTAKDDGLRARRQVRALLNNTQARMQGLYFAWDIDPDLNGWLIVGGGDLEPGDAAGITTGEWKLTLRDCFVAGRRRTHREALQITSRDRRLPTTPRDFLGRFFTNMFATQDALARVALPIGVTDPLTYGASPVLTTETTRDGSIAIAESVVDGQGISFERGETSMGLADVTVSDRNGSSDPDDWVAVFGVDQALTSGDVPVVDNGICRARWDSGYLALDAWASGAWEERGKVLVGDLVSAHLAEWTPSRAVIAIVATKASVRTQVYLTVQRGWTGPMVEAYSSTAAVRFVRARSELTNFRQPTSGLDVVASGDALGSATIATFTDRNWVEVSSASTGVGDAIAVLRNDAGTVRGADLTAYGSRRSFVEHASVFWVGARFALRTEARRWVADDFATDTSSSYTIVGSGLSIGSGRIAVSSTAVKALIRNDSDGMDQATGIKFTTGASVTTWGTQVLLRARDASNHLAAALSNSGALVIAKVVAGSATALTQLAGANLATRTGYWLVLKGNRTGGLFAALYTSDPASSPPPAPARSVFHQLSEPDLAAFPVGSGKGGFVITPGGTDWIYQNLRILPPGGDAATLAAETLIDARTTAALVART